MTRFTRLRIFSKRQSQRRKQHQTPSNLRRFRMRGAWCPRNRTTLETSLVKGWVRNPLETRYRRQMVVWTDEWVWRKRKRGRRLQKRWERIKWLFPALFHQPFLAEAQGTNGIWRKGMWFQFCEERMVCSINLICLIIGKNHESSSETLILKGVVPSSRLQLKENRRSKYNLIKN